MHYLSHHGPLPPARYVSGVPIIARQRHTLQPRPRVLSDERMNGDKWVETDHFLWARGGETKAAVLLDPTSCLQAGAARSCTLCQPNRPWELRHLVVAVSNGIGVAGYIREDGSARDFADHRRNDGDRVCLTLREVESSVCRRPVEHCGTNVCKRQTCVIIYQSDI